MSKICRSKSDCPPGPWRAEPDAEEWIDEATGYKCRLARGPLFHLCGYVSVPPGHPAHGKHYDLVDCVAHGGLTYAESDGDDWEFGFDCAHYMDLTPAYPAPGSIYRDIAYVKAGCAELAQQLAERAKQEPPHAD